MRKIVLGPPVRVVLYVNQNTRNFQMFRYGRRWHVFINHGESDKMYMTTNQFKAYDYAFIEKVALPRRLRRRLRESAQGKRKSNFVFIGHQKQSRISWLEANFD